MLYLVGTLLSKLEHIEISAPCVYFKVIFNLTTTEDEFIFKKC